ncbi:IS110 family transposase [Glycomyces sp. A-F 0318]|uniref:IS110 family transposase n=1 Tax=Glycomyces amatae TaxID=2881355 RepID=UPI001E404B1A|nr:IS110 family transposase [Glycomyces amatae]MCD0444566.1 IS110 family transposase [Glycomyces amatae]
MSPRKHPAPTSPTGLVVGVDTHKHQHVAAAVHPAQGLVATTVFGNDAPGHAALAAWAAALGPVTCFGIEGTGSWGKTLTAHLTELGARVVEAGTSLPGDRRTRGKSDPLDAENAARAVLDGRATATPKTADGPAEGLRALSIARDGAVKDRTEAANTINMLLAEDPDLTKACKGKGPKGLAQHLAHLRPGDAADPAQARRLALKSIARRWLALDHEAAGLEARIKDLTAQAAPDLLGAFGIGHLTAATILAAAGDNPDRIRTEAAFAKPAGACPLPTGSGQTAGRHRLNRGGNRQLNRALYTIALTRMAHHARTKQFVAERLARGKTKKETIRILKRHIAREIYRLLKTTSKPATATT